MADGRAPRGLPLLSGPAPSQPQDADSCRKCGREFNILFSRSRKCNHCGFMYCHGCSDFQALMPRTGPDTGYDVMNVCGYCIEYLTITAGGRTHLKSLPIAKLRKYANAYNINITRAVEKNDIIDALVNSRTHNGCLPRAHENYYRGNSVPASESRPGLRNMFRSSSNAPPPPPPRDNNPPRHQQFARPDLAPDPPFNHNMRPPPPPPRPQPPPPPPPHRPQPQAGSGAGYHPQYQQGFHSAPPPQGHYEQGHYGPPPGPPPRTQSYNPPPPQPSGGYPGQQWHQQQQPGWGQHPGYGYHPPPPPGFYPPPPQPAPHGGSFYDSGAGSSSYPAPPPPPPPPRSPRPSPQQPQQQAPPPPPPPRPRSAQPEAAPSSRGRTTSAPSAPPPVPTLDALLTMNAQEIKALSISALKSILFTNHVHAGQVLEKGELVKKVEQLVEAERLERQRAREREEMEEMERLQREREREEERERERERAREREREQQQQQERERDAEREREWRSQQASRTPDESEETIRITRLDPVDNSDDEGEGRARHRRQGSSTNGNTRLDVPASSSSSNYGAADALPGAEKPKEIPKAAPPRQGPSPASHYQERTGLCVVCQDEEANIAIVDCGHLAMCRGCSDLIMASSRECPLCRTRIVTEQRLLRIFKT